MKRSGTADLPLHHGRVPAWLAERMTRMGTAVAEAIVRDYSTSAFLSRLSDPFWFQAFGTAMGMDWHSSGITTSVIGALKRGLAARAPELGIYVCGGRGRSARNTPRELFDVAEARGFDGTALVRASRLTARIDNNALADGFQIYLHSFVLAADGEWVVVQQGLNDRSSMARRYHWHSATVRDFVAEPHSGIAGTHQGIIMNLVDRRARPAQAALLEIARDKPEKILAEARRLRMPERHQLRSGDIDLGRLGAVLAIAHDRELRQFADLLLVEKLGARTLQTLALIAEVVHGAPTRFSDPARFSFALGGKDGHPFRCRSGAMTRPWIFFAARWTGQSWGIVKSSMACAAWTGLFVEWKASFSRKPISRPRLRANRMRLEFSAAAPSRESGRASCASFEPREPACASAALRACGNY